MIIIWQITSQNTKCSIPHVALFTDLVDGADGVDDQLTDVDILCLDHEAFLLTRNDMGTIVDYCFKAYNGNPMINFIIM